MKVQDETKTSERRTRVESMYASLKDGSNYKHVPEVFPRNLHDRLLESLPSTGKVQKIVLVDVREEEERRVSRLHASAISREDCMNMLEGGDLEDKQVVAYCTIGHRSGMFASRLLERGVDASNLAGSMLLWTHEGFPLVDEEGLETKRIHVYSKEWSLEAEGYEPVWYQSPPTKRIVYEEIKARMDNFVRKLAFWKKKKKESTCS